MKILQNKTKKNHQKGERRIPLLPCHCHRQVICIPIVTCSVACHNNLCHTNAPFVFPFTIYILHDFTCVRKITKAMKIFWRNVTAVFNTDECRNRAVHPAKHWHLTTVSVKALGRLGGLKRLGSWIGCAGIQEPTLPFLFGAQASANISENTDPLQCSCSECAGIQEPISLFSATFKIGNLTAGVYWFEPEYYRADYWALYCMTRAAISELLKNWIDPFSVIDDVGNAKWLNKGERCLGHCMVAPGKTFLLEFPPLGGFQVQVIWSKVQVMVDLPRLP